MSIHLIKKQQQTINIQKQQNTLMRYHRFGTFIIQLTVLQDVSFDIDLLVLFYKRDFNCTTIACI